MNPRLRTIGGLSALLVLTVAPRAASAEQIYVTSAAGGGIVRVDAVTGAQTVVHDGRGPGCNLGGWCQLGGITLDAAGMLVYTDRRESWVSRLDPVSGNFEVIASAPQVSGPEEVVVAPNGDYLVANRGQDNILQINPSGGTTSTIAFHYSVDFALDRDNSLVAISGTSVVRISISGGPAFPISSGGSLVDIRGVAVTPDRNIWITRANGLVRVDPGNGEQTEFPLSSFLSTAGGIASTPNGDLVVTDDLSNSIVRFHPETGTAWVVSSGGSLSHPNRIAVDQSPDPVKRTSWGTVRTLYRTPAEP